MNTPTAAEAKKSADAILAERYPVEPPLDLLKEISEAAAKGYYGIRIQNTIHKGHAQWLIENGYSVRSTASLIDNGEEAYISVSWEFPK